MKERARDYWLLMRLHRPTGIWLMLWPTLWALWLAAGSTPPLHLIAGFVAGTFLLRTAACVLDDLADHLLYPAAERSRDRPLARGRVSPGHALLLLTLLAGGLAALISRFDALPLLLSVPGVVLAASYPIASKFHRLPHAHLGVACSWTIPMACAALHESMPLFWPWMLMLANLCWVIAYDAYYALSSREIERLDSLRARSILFGRWQHGVITLVQLAGLLLLIGVGIRTRRGPAYYVGLVFAAGFILRQFRLSRDLRRDVMFRVFLISNGFGAAVFAGLTWDFAFEAYAATQPVQQATVGMAGLLTANGCDDPLPLDERPAADPVVPDYGYCVQRDLTYTPENWPRPLQADVFTPDREALSPVVIMVYGGNWAYGGRRSMDPVAVALARRGYVVLNVSHRVIPGSRFPAPLQDLQQAVRWMHGKAGEWHADPARLGAWGFSSGAHLAAMLAMIGPDDPWGAPDVRVRALVADGLPSDLLRLEDSALPMLLGATAKENPRLYRHASPLYQVTPQSPPTFIYSGQADTEVPLEQALLMRDALRKAGVRVQLEQLAGAGHGRMSAAEVQTAAAFLDQQLKP